MRSKVALGIWLLGISLAWMAVAPADLGVMPLVDAQGAALGWWQLRQHTIYLSGLWSIGLMALVLLLALRLPLLDRLLGGMDQVYRLHKWAGIAAALTAIAHWGAKESSGWIKALWGRAGAPCTGACTQGSVWTLKGPTAALMAKAHAVAGRCGWRRAWV